MRILQGVGDDARLVERAVRAETDTAATAGPQQTEQDREAVTERERPEVAPPRLGETRERRRRRRRSGRQVNRPREEGGRMVTCWGHYTVGDNRQELNYQELALGFNDGGHCTRSDKSITTSDFEPCSINIL